MKKNLPEVVTVHALVGMGLTAMGILLHVAGLATTEWSSFQVDDISHGVGLWKTCKKVYISECCMEYQFDKLSSQLANSIKACEAFAILGMLTGLLGLIMAGVTVLCPAIGKPKNQCFPVISWASCVAALIFIYFTILVWAVFVNGRDFAELQTTTELRTGYSFISSIVGGFLLGAGGVVIRLSNI